MFYNSYEDLKYSLYTLIVKPLNRLQIFLDNLFSKYLIFKRVSYMHWLFKKIKKGSETSF